MKICWFDEHRLGVVHDGVLRDVSPALAVLPVPRYPAERGDTLIANLAEVRTEIERLVADAPVRNLQEVKLLSPVANPTKIMGTPVNYLKHIEEAHADRENFSQKYQGGIEEQGIFLKATSSLVGCGEGVHIRFPERRTDHEIELGAVIGRRCSNVSEADALSYIAGYSIALDMVVRGPEDRSLRKSIDTYSVLGPWLVTADEILDPTCLSFKLSVNGEQRQASNTRHMIMSIARQISWLSQFYTLWPGDVLMTGTCEGVGRVLPGDTMLCEIEQVGEMTVAVH